MGSRRTIVFLGAPSAEEALKTWKGHNLPEHYPQNEGDVARLPEFEIDSSHRTEGVVWRRLTDPVKSLSQELAETTMESRTPEEVFLERSLQIFHDDGDDEDEEMDIDVSEISIFPRSQISTPFLTGYDFDVNEITELEDLPPANKVTKNLSRNYSLLVAIQEITQFQLVKTKYGKEIALVKLIVADQTTSGLEVACWDQMALVAENMRVDDIVYFRGICLTDLS